MSNDSEKERGFDEIDSVARYPSRQEITTYREHIRAVALEIAETLLRKDEEYGGSWLKRGGVGAYMMKVRKSDRLEEQVKRRGYDVFATMEQTRDKSETLSDTLLDDAGYAILILAEARARGLTIAGK